MNNSINQSKFPATSLPLFRTGIVTLTGKLRLERVRILKARHFLQTSWGILPRIHRN